MYDSPLTTETVSVVFAANDYYTPYLSTLLASILSNYDNKRPLEFIVLAREFTPANEQRLIEQAEEGGATLAFIDVGKAMAPYEKKLHTWAHFKIETYFRLLLPQLLPYHHKVLYLDSDMVCLANIAELFDTDVEGFLVAACKDPDTTGIYEGVEVDLGQPDKKRYMDEVLKIKNPYDYFQAGTILFNLDEWRRSLDVEEVFAFAQAEKWQLLDQDVLNYFCQGRVRFIDMAWNVMFDNGGFRISDIISHTTPELFDAYLSAREAPKIIHYAGPFKPWMDPSCDFGDVFWHYARMTTFYEMMILRECHETQDKTLKRVDALSDYIHTIDQELRRYEQRSATLMFKEFCFQKVLTPLSHLLFKSEASHEKAERLYRKIHPKKKAKS